MQHVFSIRLSGWTRPQGRRRLVPVDAKFPLEAWQRLLGATWGPKRARGPRLRALPQERIDEIADKYIRPDEGTYDFALMYIPRDRSPERSLVGTRSGGCTSREVIGAFVGTDVLVGDLVDRSLRERAKARPRRLGFGPGRPEQPLHASRETSPSTGTRRSPTLRAASTRSPDRNTCCIWVVGAGKDLSQQLLGHTSPIVPRSFGHGAAAALP